MRREETVTPSLQNTFTSNVAHNVFMRCQRRQQGAGGGVQRVTATCVLQKSDTDTANSFGAVTQAGGQGNKTPLVAQRGGINA